MITAGGTSWALTPFGLLAAAFPGFIIGYFRTTDGPFASALAVYGTVGAWSAASLVIVMGLILALRLRAAVALVVLGGASLVAYYWFAAPRLVEAYGGGPLTGELVRVVAMLGIVAWAVRGWRRVTG